MGEGGVGMNRWGTGTFRVGKVFRDTVMVDTCPYMFVKAHRMYNIKSESCYKLRTLVNNNVSILASQS